MVGYKVGQKVLLLDGTLLNIEDVQEGMSLQTIVLPNDDNVKEAKYWSSKEINGLEFTSSEVNKVSTENQDYITINELSLRDKEILVYNTLNKTFEFKNVNNLYLGDDHKLVRITNESILLENIYNYEKSTNKEDLISISLHGPFHYLLDGYVVHNVGTVCIQNCQNNLIACINNTSNPSLVAGQTGFVDNSGSCWIAISDCNSCTPNASFIGSISSVFIGNSCSNCTGDSGNEPPVNTTANVLSNVVKLRRCDSYSETCPEGTLAPGECSYPLDGKFVTITNIGVIPLPYLGQTVKITQNFAECCYKVIDFKGTPEASADIDAVYDDCEECCTTSGPQNGLFRQCCAPFSTVSLSYTQGTVGDIYTLNGQCYTLTSTGGNGGPVATLSRFADCQKCIDNNPCSIAPSDTPTPTPTITPTTTIAYEPLLLLDCCTRILKKSILVPSSIIQSLINDGASWGIEGCCYFASEKGGDGSDGIFNDAEYNQATSTIYAILNSVTYGYDDPLSPQFLNTAKDSATAGSPLADYAFAGLENERISVALAGIIGVLLTAAISFGLFTFLKKR